MFGKLKDFLAKHKVSVVVVGGVVVVATAFGTCSFDPSEVSSVEVEETNGAETVSVTGTTAEGTTGTAAEAAAEGTTGTTAE
tara:strand:+ start:404 stop:649 length:246 start_codon:yes stop_codon:yes gene_type:complete